MLKTGDLFKAFEVYWHDANGCLNAKAYWWLLHVMVSLPDVCASLESANGVTNANHYKDWCTKYFTQLALNASERWDIRCKDGLGSLRFIQ